MGMGRRPAQRQGDLWVAATELPQSPGHVFYEKLNALLAEADFDRHVENLCQKYYVDGVGRDSIPPGVYFRMLFVGYFEALDSQRAIAWRCSDSLSVRAFLGLPLTEPAPDHSSLTRIRQRLPQDVHERVFVFVLTVAQEKKLLGGKTVAVDATTLEANAAMRSIVRKDTGEGYQDYLKRLAIEAGMTDPTAEDLRRFDRKRPKKGSNQEWESPADPDSRIAKMKDGRTHLAYKAEHVVALDSEFVLAAQVYSADRADPATLVESVLAAQVHVVLAGSCQEIEEAAADKGYHKAETLAACVAWNTRTYIPEPKRRHRRKWVGKPESWRRAVAANRRRVKGARGKRLQKKRSELAERSFAHVCETGGGRRTWLRGLEDVTKRYVVQVAAHNLGLLMRKLFGVGKPRTLQGAGGWLVWVAVCWYGLSALWGGRSHSGRAEPLLGHRLLRTEGRPPRIYPFFNGLIGPPPDSGARPPSPGPRPPAGCRGARPSPSPPPAASPSPPPPGPTSPRASGCR
jgi:transposase